MCAVFPACVCPQLTPVSTVCEGHITFACVCMRACLQERAFAEAQAKQQAEWKREQAVQKETAAKRRERAIADSVRSGMGGG